jgi:exopolyphosphatase / guanosine-5'-triphosphate,3'-diphosphate pyrophosphatase
MNLIERGDVFAALDLGTTNCRLLVAKPAGDGMRIIDSFSRIVRLGEGLASSGVLSQAAQRRTIEALDICASKLAARRVTHARFVATEACRRAANCGGFLQWVKQATGIELEIISTEEEARLALVGCTPLLEPRPDYAVVFDIGGGSTEILWVGIRRRRSGRLRTEIRGVVSLPFGVVSLTERFSRGEPPARQFDQMVAQLRGGFAEFDAKWRISELVARGQVQMLGSSGTVTTLAGIQLGLPRYDRSQVDGVSLALADIEEIIRELVVMDPAERAKQPCIGPGRADLMMAGCAILQAICATWPVERLRVADRGVREGILVGLMEEAKRTNRTAAPPAGDCSPPPLPLPT